MNEQNIPDQSLPAAGDPGALEALFLRRMGRAADSPFVSPDPLIARGEADAGRRGLIAAYRAQGHLAARLDPLEQREPETLAALDPASHGLEASAAKPLLDRLRAVYRGPLGWESAHIHDEARRRWLIAQAERPGAGKIAPEMARAMLALVARAHFFEDMLGHRLPGAKLFGLGGAESFLACLEAILIESSGHGVGEVVVGGMHRGRFNLIANTAGKPLTPLISEILGAPPVPPGIAHSGDVSYHLGYSGTRMVGGKPMRFSVSPHPSHLQIAPTISLGRARAKQTMAGPGGAGAVLPLLLHTDAGFSGQGIMMEMFQFARLKPFDVGGAIHVIINNQVGFTTSPEEGRSSRYCSDIGRIAGAPVIHVNGDDVAAVVRAGQTAARYRAEFASDVVIEIVCYRRPGHNEIDEPRFTQPVLQSLIDARPPVHEIFARQIEATGIETDIANVEAAYRAEIDAAFKAAPGYEPNDPDCFAGAWEGLRAGTEAEMTEFTETGIAPDRLKALGAALTAPPEGFALEPKVARFLAQRLQSIETGEGINWASAEALALASLLDEGTPVRLGGQDTMRGAFTQRHLALHDQATGARHIVLDGLARAEAQAEIFNTPLSEFGPLTFDYGISLADPRRLVVWEAQFGEFLNVAQAVFDQCIACGEDRWRRASGLVILLPHGLDGGGPDHSTARPERLLAACAGGNLQIVNASTPANFFHALRRQMHRPFRKPLVVLTPKYLLRHKDCVSPLADFASGTGFRAVIGDDAVPAAKKVILCTGKVYYALKEARRERGLDSDVALVRIEQLYPFPRAALEEALAPHKGAEIIWCQEEPRNMGYYAALDRTLEEVAGGRVAYAGRPAVATPAVGTKEQHKNEEAALVEAALGGTK